MKKCILVWQVPVIEGEPYNPVEYAVHVRKAKKFAEALNRYFAEKIWTTIVCWTIFPVWYLIGKKYILLPVIQSVFEETSYSDAYLIANYLWNLMSAINTICISRNCVLSGLYKKRKCCFWDSRSYEHQFDA